MCDSILNTYIQNSALVPILHCRVIFSCSPPCHHIEGVVVSKSIHGLHSMETMVLIPRTSTSRVLCKLSVLTSPRGTVPLSHPAWHPQLLTVGFFSPSLASFQRRSRRAPHEEAPHERSRSSRKRHPCHKSHGGVQTQHTHGGHPASNAKRGQGCVCPSGPHAGLPKPSPGAGHGNEGGKAAKPLGEQSVARGRQPGPARQPQPTHQNVLRLRPSLRGARENQVVLLLRDGAA